MPEDLAGYPSNHRYRIHGQRLVPGYQLYRRANVVESLYPQALTSLLDIGCCRGYYVFQGGLRPECRAAVGIDVFEPFIRTARRVQDYLGIRNVQFHLAGLDQVAQNPAAYGGPFQTIVLIGAYHYLYWGSVRCGQAFLSHREILSRLAGLCTDRVIFSARLRIADLPEGLRRQALGSSAGEDFNAEAFLRTAEDFFQVRQAGYLGNYPAYVLSRQAQKVGSPAIR